MQVISIHAPRTGSDNINRRTPCRKSNFNPRSPHGERRNHAVDAVLRGEISIHAPRTGSDSTAPTSTSLLRNFNPRSPHGERRCGRDAPTRAVVISIHAPRAGSDKDRAFLNRRIEISIHAPRTGSDLMALSTATMINNFNPRSPHGERPVVEVIFTAFSGNFNPRSPHGERHTGTQGVVH